MNLFVVLNCTIECMQCLYQWKSLTSISYESYIYDNLHYFVYNGWQHGSCITHRSFKIQVLHVPKRGALRWGILRAIFYLCFAINYFSDGDIRPRNINWQDWKYTSFSVFIRHSQNNRRHNAKDEYKPHDGRRWKHWIETPISELIFNPFRFT